MRAAQWRWELEESQRRGRAIVITQGQPEGPQAASVPSPSTGAAEFDFEMTGSSSVWQSLVLVEEVSDQ